MNSIIIKQTALLSTILGAIIGVLTLIPIVRNFSFLILMLCLSSVVIVYMKKNNLIGVINLQEGAILGGVIGFVSFLAFSIVFIPLVTIVGAIFKNYYTFGISYMLKVSGFFVLVMLVGFMGILGALMNAFAGLATAYGYEILSGIRKEENENIDYEIEE